MLRRHGAIQSGDAVAVGIPGRVAELGSDSFFKMLGDEVFEAFGLVMQFVEGIIQDFKEKGFYEAVMADDFQSAFAAWGR